MIALYDASVLYSGMVRDLLIRLALADLVQAKWTEAIQEEWIGALRRNRPDLPLANHERVRQLMAVALPDARVTGYEDRIENLTLPDKDDRHVLAAAIHCQASRLVTFNLKDFPQTTLEPYSLEAQHPDVFTCSLLESAPDRVVAVIEEQRKVLRNPPKTSEQMLLDFAERGLKDFAESLRGYL